MRYKSETIGDVLPRINTSYFLPALQREFVWTEDQVCQLFDSLLRRYPISSFLFWQVPIEERDDVETYEFLRTVKEARNRAQLARVHGRRDLTFVLDGLPWPQSEKRQGIEDLRHEEAIPGPAPRWTST